MVGEVRPGAGSQVQAVKLVERAAQTQAVTLYAAIRSASQAGASVEELAEASGLPGEMITRLLERGS